MVSKNEEIKIHCKNCEHTWKCYLEDLKKIIYRGKKTNNLDVIEYRAKCPACGVYMVILIAKDD